MRGIKESLSLFEYIVNNYNTQSFEHDIKERIAQEHENTLGTIAFNAMNNTIIELKPSIELYFENIEKNTETEIQLDEILNHFNPIASQKINLTLNSVRDNQEVSKYIDQFKYVVSNVIRRRYDSYQRKRNEQFNEKQQLILYEKQLSQDESKNTETQKIIAEKMLINKLHAIVSKSFLDMEQNEIEILRGKLHDLPFYKETYNNKNGITNDIKNSIEEKLLASFDELIDKAVCEMKKENPQLNSIFDEVINTKKDAIKEKNHIKVIVDSNIKSIQNDVINSYSEAKENLADIKHEIKREGNGLKVRVSEKTIYTFPDGKVQEDDWKVVRSEWKTFDDIVEGAGKIISFMADIGKTIVSPLKSLYELFSNPKTPEPKEK